jgi:hypothetical protein
VKLGGSEEFLTELTEAEGKISGWKSFRLIPLIPSKFPMQNTP